MPEMSTGTETPEQVGDLLGSGVTKDDLIKAQQTLELFRATSHDEFGEEQQWIRTALAAVVMARTEYTTEVHE